MKNFNSRRSTLNLVFPSKSLNIVIKKDKKIFK